MGNLCRSWVDALDNFHYRPLDAQGELGVAKLMPDIIAGLGRLDQFDCYVCMPEPLLDTVTGYLLDHGGPPGQLHAEPLR
jgi:CDP-4-dehydro-6-deoxyglucose reductase